MSHGGGDDLYDDFVIDNDLVAVSEDEGAADGDSGFFSEEEAEEEFGGIESGAEEEQEEEGDEKEQKEKDDAKALKKRKRREKEKERKAKKRKLIEGAAPEAPKSIAAQSPAELADYCATKQAKTFSKMSALELEDMRIPESSIADTTSWEDPRSLDRLVDFIVKTLPELQTTLSQKPSRNSAPSLIFLTGAALRVADVTRILKDKRISGKNGGGVAKLFARHFKLSEHVAYLRRSKIGSAVGTPGRIGKLLCETEAIYVPAITHIMLDTTYQDAKKRSLLDIPETRDEVFKTVLGAPAVSKRIKEGKIKVVFF